MKTKTILVLIVLLGALLRIWQISNFPALNADEAAIGYNTYSLIQTGKDEHGNSWPIHFQSFNDYKPGGYFYLVLPFVRLLGLSTLAVRLPSVLLAITSIYIIYLLAFELTKNRTTALVSALFLAVSPWHIHFSRGGWEVNVATFLILTGVLFFQKSKTNPKYLFLSAAMFAFSLYTYHAARIIAPLIVLFLAAQNYKGLINKSKNTIYVTIFGLILVAPLALDLLGPAGISRATGVGLFADTGPLSRVNEQRGEHNNFDSLIPKIFHNKPINYTLAFLDNWGSHYWGEFLFLSGDEIERNKVPETGQLYIYDFVLILIGMYIVTKNIKNPEHRLILFWLLIAPIPSALTFQSPHALRAQNMVVPLVLVSAIGLTALLKFVEKYPYKKLALTIICLVIAWEAGRYLHMYWNHLAVEYPYSSQYGIKELVAYTEKRSPEFEKILITDRYDQPYILFLFYLKYPPEQFQQEHQLTSRDQFGFSTVRSFDKYEFRSIKFDEDRPNMPRTLIAGTDEEIPDDTNIIKEIWENNFKYFDIVAN